VVEGSPPETTGKWTDWLEKDAERNVVRSVPRGSSRGAQEASLQFRVLGRDSRATLVELRPHTGRSHQLRVQLASRGLPIVGDRKYGAASTLLAEDGRPRVALHALQLTFIHPTRSEAIVVAAPAPADFPWRSSEAPGAPSGSSRPGGAPGQ